MTRDRLRTDAFLAAFREEAEEALAALRLAAGRLERGEPAGVALRDARTALDGLAGAASFVGRRDFETAAAAAGRVLETFDAVAPADRARALASARDALSVLEGLLEAMFGAGAPDDAARGKPPSVVPAQEAWTEEELSHFGRLVCATFADCAVSLGRYDLLGWPAFVDAACRVDFASQCAESGLPQVAAGGVRVDRAQARPLAAWLARLAQSIRRCAAAAPRVAAAGRLAGDPAACRAEITIEGLAPGMAVAADPQGLETFGAEVRRRRLASGQTCVELVLPRAIPLAAVVLFEKDGAINALPFALPFAGCHDVGAIPSPARTDSAHSGTMETMVPITRDAVGRMLDDAGIRASRILGPAVATVRLPRYVRERADVSSGQVCYRGRDVPLRGAPADTRAPKN